MSMETQFDRIWSSGTGHRLKDGELKDNSKAVFFLCLAHSLFEGKHSATYKFGFLKSLLDNLFDARKNRDFYYLDLLF